MSPHPPVVNFNTRPPTHAQCAGWDVLLLGFDPQVWADALR